MNNTLNSQSDAREAQGSSIRPVKVNPDSFRVSGRQQRKARSIARQIDGSRTVNPRTVAPICAVLTAFGGRITAFEISGQ